MTSPLDGTDLIDCAKANSTKGIEVAAERCGYGSNLLEFEQQLKQACKRIGIDIQGFEDLNKPPTTVEPSGVEVAPDTPTQF